jgi:ankyrin repeat protein
MHSNIIGPAPINNQAPTKPLLSDVQWQEFLNSLKFDQIDTRQMTIRNAHARTCKWLLKNSKYLDWLDAGRLNEHHGFLWIRGKPGTGKSTLMKFALINARKTMKDRIMISFFFNARGEDIEKSTIGTYRSLLLQLLEWLPALRDSLSLPLSFSTNYQWNVEGLKALLEQAIMGLEKSSVVCFIDALDECEEEQIRDMIQFFEHIGDLAVSNSIRFQVCFSSRHYPHITIRKGLDLVLEGQEGHTQDISDYLEIELKIGQSNIAQQIRTEIQEKAAGIFMWVVLVVGILNKEYDGGRIYALQRRLQEIPSDLHELFRDILTRDSCNGEELVLGIQWVLFAKQPLSPEQLYLAILSGVEPNAVSRWNRTETTMDVIKRFILSSSKGLAEITTSKPHTVQFIHESVRDFLLKDGLGNIWSDLGSNLQGQSHERLKQCCLNYMSMDVLALLEIPKSYPTALLQQAADLRKWTADRFPFLKYAVRNVLYHADSAEGGGITQAEFFRSFLFPRWVELDNLFRNGLIIGSKIRTYTEDVKLLYVLAERNMSNLIRIHPSILSWFEVGKEHYGPPLVAALATGSKEAVRAFVQALAVHQSPGSQLYEMCSQYSKDKVRGGKLSHDFSFSTYTLLSYLAELGDEVIFALVLETGKVYVNSKDHGGRTPLLEAVSNGHEAIFKLLLETGKVDVNSKDQGGQTPLQKAASNGHKAIVKLLLETGKVDVDAKDLYRRTPLWWAASKGHEAVAKLLLETGKVDVNSKNQGGQTPLSWAAENGHEAVVKLLLETGKVEVDSKDTLYEKTPLSWAASNGNEAVVKLLLETGKTDIDAKNLFGWTPLQGATSQGHEAVVRLLLETGKVDVNSKNQDGRTLLSWAALNGHEAIVKLLLETGKVDIDSKDRSGQTPLSWAARCGHKAVVKLLLETGKVDVNSKDTLYRNTPLSWAAKRGHKAVVKLLQSHI